MRAVPIGKGIVDYETFFDTLREIGYQGYIAYEMCAVLDGGGDIEIWTKPQRNSLSIWKGSNKNQKRKISFSGSKLLCSPGTLPV